MNKAAAYQRIQRIKRDLIYKIGTALLPELELCRLNDFADNGKRRIEPLAKIEIHNQTICIRIVHCALLLN